MRKLTFTPSVCLPTKGEDGGDVPAKYAGTVTIKVPTNLERMELLESFDPDDVKDPKKAAKAMRGLIASSVAWVLAVDLKRVEDGLALTSYDDVAYESELSTLQVEIANRLVGKHKVMGVDAETGEPAVVAGTLGN